MSSGPPAVRVGDVALKITKGTTPPQFVPGPHPSLVSFIKVESIAPDGALLETKFAYIDAATNAALSRSILREDDLLFTIAGTIGRVAHVKAKYLPGNTNQAVAIVRPNPDIVDVRYLYYVLGDKVRVQRAMTRVVQSVQANFSLAELANLTVPLPSLPEQRRIAGVLGALDDLIDTNRSLVSSLWEAAEAAYSSAILGAPRRRLADVLELRYGKSLPARLRKPGTVPVVSSAGIVDRHNTALVRGPGVVVGRKGTVGTVTWVPTDFFPIDTAFFVESDLPPLYAYFALRSLGLEHMNTDSAVPGLNRENALSREIPVPNEEKLSPFMKSTQVITPAIEQVEREIEQVTRARDELLPLLMSGRITVDEAWETVP